MKEALFGIIVGVIILVGIAFLFSCMDTEQKKVIDGCTYIGLFDGRQWDWVHSGSCSNHAKP